MLNGARVRAKAICAYLQEEAGWTFGPGTEIDVLMAVLHAERVEAKEAT